ncbi:uncharacterized protein [Anabrus simplex]|uniref:uncharacterized protein n=1 Tax=Anabrus simplex TaxID=316456 RepID=UPI0035A378F1
MAVLLRITTIVLKSQFYLDNPYVSSSWVGQESNEKTAPSSFPYYTSSVTTRCITAVEDPTSLREENSMDKNSYPSKYRLDLARVQTCVTNVELEAVWTGSTVEMATTTSVRFGTKNRRVEVPGVTEAALLVEEAGTAGILEGPVPGVASGIVKALAGITGEGAQTLLGETRVHHRGKIWEGVLIRHGGIRDLHRGIIGEEALTRHGEIRDLHRGVTGVESPIHLGGIRDLLGTTEVTLQIRRGGTKVLHGTTEEEVLSTEAQVIQGGTADLRLLLEDPQGGGMKRGATVVEQVEVAGVGEGVLPVGVQVEVRAVGADLEEGPLHLLLLGVRVQEDHQFGAVGVEEVKAGVVEVETGKSLPLDQAAGVLVEAEEWQDGRNPAPLVLPRVDLGPGATQQREVDLLGCRQGEVDLRAGKSLQVPGVDLDHVALKVVGEGQVGEGGMNVGDRAGTEETVVLLRAPVADSDHGMEQGEAGKEAVTMAAQVAGGKAMTAGMLQVGTTEVEATGGNGENLEAGETEDTYHMILLPAARHLLTTGSTTTREEPHIMGPMGDRHMVIMGAMAPTAVMAHRRQDPEDLGQTVEAVHGTVTPGVVRGAVTAEVVGAAVPCIAGQLLICHTCTTATAPPLALVARRRHQRR